ncbi:MAG: hypothetical protein JJU02_17050 [Cryomorphaceae bacterium]|nr:hypothetical protein [Cryomorphaceae bacterium]
MVKYIFLIFGVVLSGCNYIHERCVVGTYKTIKLEEVETLEILPDNTFIHSFKNKKYSGTWRLIEGRGMYISLENWIPYQAPYRDEVGISGNRKVFANCRSIGNFDDSSYYFYKVK